MTALWQYFLQETKRKGLPKEVDLKKTDSPMEQREWDQLLRENREIKLAKVTILGKNKESRYG